MVDAKVLLYQNLDFSERYRAELRVYEVPPGKRFPHGVKVSFPLST